MKKTAPIFLFFLLTALLAACQNEGPLPTPAATVAVSSAENEAAVAESSEEETAVSEPINTPEPTATPAPPTPTPLPPKPMTVCLGAEPTSLFLYRDDSLAATAVRHALYENLYTTLNYDYQPQGLQKLPSLNDGDARIGLVAVTEGDLIVNSAGNREGTASRIALDAFVANLTHFIREIKKINGKVILLTTNPLSSKLEPFRHERPVSTGMPS